MKAQDKLDKALATITLEPQLAFWAGLSVQVPKVLTEDVPTAATDGERILFNPSFLEPLTNGQVVFLILHELMHIIRMDAIRAGERDRYVWNIAADAVINDLLRDFSGVVEPIPDGVYPDGELESLKGQAAEWNYKWLLQKEPPEQGAEGSGEGTQGAGEVLGSRRNGVPAPHDEILPNEEIDSNPDSHENKVKRMVQAAAQMARERGQDPTAGNSPAWLREFIAELVEPRVDWRATLRDFMGAVAKQDWTWRRPNSSILLSSGCIAPTVQSQPGVPHVAVLLDSSASVNDDLLAQAWGEIKGMADIIQRLTVAHFTTGVDAVETYDMQVNAPDDIVPCERYSGGTSIPKAMDALFERVEQGEVEAPDVLIILSDMESPMPEAEPSVPVVWAALGAGRFEAPFGATVNVK